VGQTLPHIRRFVLSIRGVGTQIVLRFIPPILFAGSLFSQGAAVATGTPAAESQEVPQVQVAVQNPSVAERVSAAAGDGWVQ